MFPRYGVELETALGRPVAVGVEAHGMSYDTVAHLKPCYLTAYLDDLAGDILAQDEGIRYPFPLLITDVLLGPVHRVDRHRAVLNHYLLRTRRRVGRGLHLDQFGTRGDQPCCFVTW